MLTYKWYSNVTPKHLDHQGIDDNPKAMLYSKSIPDLEEIVVILESNDFYQWVMCYQLLQCNHYAPNNNFWI